MRRLRNVLAARRDRLSALIAYSEHFLRSGPFLINRCYWLRLAMTCREELALPQLLLANLLLHVTFPSCEEIQTDIR